MDRSASWSRVRQSALPSQLPASLQRSFLVAPRIPQLPSVHSGTGYRLRCRSLCPGSCRTTPALRTAHESTLIIDLDPPDGYSSILIQRECPPTLRIG